MKNLGADAPEPPVDPAGVHAGGAGDQGHGANYVFARLPFPPLRQEAKVQGVTDVKVWDCELPCYDPKVIEERRSGHRRASTSASSSCRSTRRSRTRCWPTSSSSPDADKVDGYAPQAFAATLAFRRRSTPSCRRTGKNGLTRAAVLEALAKDVNDFDADGMIAPDRPRRTPRSAGAGSSCRSRTRSSCASTRRSRVRSSCARATCKVVELDLLR